MAFRSPSLSSRTLPMKGLALKRPITRFRPTRTQSRHFLPITNSYYSVTSIPLSVRQPLRSLAIQRGEPWMATPSPPIHYLSLRFSSREYLISIASSTSFTTTFSSRQTVRTSLRSSRLTTNTTPFTLPLKLPPELPQTKVIDALVLSGTLKAQERV